MLEEYAKQAKDQKRFGRLTIILVAVLVVAALVVMMLL
jgi:hypothetical protein